MKLKDKRTGEIGKLKESNCEEYEYVVVIDGNPQVYRYYHTLKEITDSYEDYEEKPKEYWVVDIRDGAGYKPYLEEPSEMDFEIGNYFETEEEAKLAVKKLKAWERLQGKGFKIRGWNMAMQELYVEVPAKFFDKLGPITMEVSDETEKDLDLLFRDTKNSKEQTFHRADIELGGEE